MMKVLEAYRNDKKYAFFIGCIIGAIVFFAIYGVAIINPCYVDWLFHSDDLEGSIDLTQHYLGWVFYRNTPWRFPIGLTDGIFYEPVSVIYTDSIPLLAFFFKLFSFILPSDFQYFGIYGLLCYALIGGFSALIARRFSDNILWAIFAAVIFSTNPVILNRMYLHTALAGHFLIVAGIVLWIYRDDFKAKKYRVMWCILLTCGTLINAYFTPMLLGTLLCSELQWLLKRKECVSKCDIEKVNKDKSVSVEALKRITLDILFPFAVTLASCYAFGMFYGSVNASGGGLDMLSFNLDGLFNPMTYLSNYGKRTFTDDEFLRFSYSGIMREFPLYSPYQNEGFAYLGLGVLLLLGVEFIVLFVLLVQRKLSINKSWYISIAIYFIVFGFLALSPRWTLGMDEILYINYSEAIYKLLSTFRSTGRFIWMVYYMLLAGAVVMPFKIKQGIWAEENVDVLDEKKASAPLGRKDALFTVIFFFFTILQAVDLTPGFVEKHNAFSNIKPYETRLSDSEWDRIVSECDMIIFYPPTLDALYFDCKTSMEFEILALKYGIPLNMTYMSRDLTEQADEWTYKHFEDRKSGKVQSHNLYIFCSEENIPSGAESGLRYYELNGYTIGIDE